MFSYTERELELITALEECNYEFLLAKEKERTYIRKSRFTFDRVKKSLEYRSAVQKYCKLYGVGNYPKKLNELQWDTTKKDDALYCREDKKIVIYTCIAGKYDSVSEPRFLLNPNITYVLFTDQKMTSKVWDVRTIPKHLMGMSGVQINRYLKMHPHEFLSEFDYSIYIDGNVLVVSDMSGLVNFVNPEVGIAMHLHCVRNCIYQEAVSCQSFKKGDPNGITMDVEQYLREGYPRENGLVECTVFVTDLNSEISREVCIDWWNEFLNSSSKRDQLSLPVVLWRKGIPIEKIGTLGANLYRNPKFRVKSHL